MPRRLAKNKVMDAETRGWVRALIRSEMTLRSLTYRDLAALLTAAGLEENDGNLRSKVTRGELSAATFLAVLGVMRIRTLDLASVLEMGAPDPSDRPTIDMALQDDLIGVKSRDDDTGEYTVTVGLLHAPIKILLEQRSAEGSTVYKLSHIIDAVGFPEKHAPALGFDTTPAKCLRRAIQRLVRPYKIAIEAGMKPSENWARAV